MEDGRQNRKLTLLSILPATLLTNACPRLGGRRRWEAAQRKAAEKRAQGLKDTPKKRLMQEDVLYLMIANMPTEAELKKARDKMEEENRSKVKRS